MKTNWVRLSAAALLCGSVFAGSVSAGDAYIESFSPQGTVKQVRQARAHFSSQIVDMGDPRAKTDIFDISCPEKGKARWAGGKDWIYDFDRDLSPGVKCTFKLKPGVASGQNEYSFSTGGPSIKRSQPHQGTESIDEDQIFALLLDGEVKEESIAANASFNVEGIAGPVGVRVITGAERKKLLKIIFHWGMPKEPVVLLQARQHFPSNTHVSLVWGKGVQTPSGVGLAQEQVLPFATRKPFEAEFSCERENAQAACLPITPMRLNFTSNITTASAQGITLVLPDGSTRKPDRAKKEKADFVGYVEFKGPFAENAEFTVEVPKGLADDAGRGLANGAKFPLKVRTDAFPPLAKFSAVFGILESKDPVLPVTLRNIEEQVPAEKIELKGTALRAGGSLREARSWLLKLFKHDREKSIFGDKDDSAGEGKSFKIAKPQGSRAFEVVGIPLDGPGFYVVEIQSNVLGAHLLAAPATMFVPTAVLVTNLAVHFKWGQDSSLVWVTSLDSAEPVEDAEVTITDCKGNGLWTGKTGEHGVARVDKLPRRDEVPSCTYEQMGNGLFVAAAKEGDFSFVHTSWDKGIESWRFQLPWEPARDNTIAHTVLDRSLLRAGETVHMKHVLRRHVMQGFNIVSPVSDKLPKAVVIYHNGGEQKYEFPLTWQAGGVAETTWKIPREAKLGSYEIMLAQELSKPDDAASGLKSNRVKKGRRRRQRGGSGEGFRSGSFRVEEFRLPLMRAQVLPPKGDVIGNSSFHADVLIGYLAGGGAAGLNVKLRSQVQPKYVGGFEGFEGYEFANGPVDEKRTHSSSSEESDFSEEPSTDTTTAATKDAPIASHEQALDKSGFAQIAIGGLSDLKTPKEVLAEAEFKDPNGEVQTVAARIPVWPASVLVGLKPEGWAASKEKVKFYAAVVDLKGNPIKGTEVAVDAYERITYSHRKRLVGGLYAYENFNEVKKLGHFCEGTTDVHGLVICEKKAPAVGTLIFQARAKDGEGREVTAHHEMWVAGDEPWAFEQGDSDRIDLLPEKKRYEPGDTARFQVRMPFQSATALVTVEREGVTELFVQTLTSSSPVIEVPVKGNYAPNIFVSVLVVRGRVGDVQPTALVDLGRPAYKLGIAEINVGWRAHELKVSVKPEQAVYKVRQKARVKIAVRAAAGQPLPKDTEVALAAVDEGLLELSPNTSWKILAAMMGRRGYEVETSTAQMQVIGKRHFGLKALASGGGGGRRTTRELFDTLLFWKARVKLNANGEGAVEIPLNDSVTSFRIVAVATGAAGMFGEGEASIRATQDLMVLPGVSPLVREGDSFSPEFTVRNTTEHEMSVTLSGRVEGLPQAIAAQTFKLAGGEAKELSWKVVAPGGVEQLKYQIDASEPGGEADHVKVTQKILPAVPVRTFQAELSQLADSYKVQVKMPADALAGRGGVRVALRAKLGDGLAGVREYMSLYPYDCLEQRMSVAVALGDRAGWKKIVADLPTYLDQDGLLKYFPTMWQGSDALTSYVVSIAGEAGFQIPDDSLERILSGLERFVEGKITRGSALATTDLHVRKLAALVALARQGKTEPKLLSTLTLEPNLWPTSAVLDWFDYLRLDTRVPERDAHIAEAEQILRARLNFQGTTMGFSTDTSDFFWWLMVSADSNSVRLLHSLLSAGKWADEMPKLVRGALARQHHGAWSQTTANAWGVLAMQKFSALYEKTPVSGVTKVSLGGNDGGQKQHVEWKGRVQDVPVLDFKWPSGSETLLASHEGAGKPWITVQSRAAIPLKEAFSSGYKIAKTWTGVQQKTAGRWSRGDLVRVHLDLEAQADMTWVVVTDPVPGGATVLGSGLGRDSQLGTRKESQGGWAFPAFTERSFEAFRSYFEFVPKGKWSVEYTIRLNQEGTYHQPPTRVEAMYSPEMLGEIPNPDVEVLQ